MKYAVCIPTYNRPELVPKAVESILKDPTNSGFPIFVSSDSVSGYKTKEIENLKKICNNHSKIYYMDTERSESYKRQLEKLSGLSREVVSMAMNGGSAGANRNRLLLLTCTDSADSVIFLDDDMEVEPSFIEYHALALGNTVSQFISKVKNYKGTNNKELDVERLNQNDMKKNIGVFAPYFLSASERNRDHLLRHDMFHDLGKSDQIDGGNLSLLSLVYSTIPFPTNSTEEDWILGLFARKMLEPLNGIVLVSNHPTCYENESVQNISKKMLELQSMMTRKCGNVVFRELLCTYQNVVKTLPSSSGGSYGRRLVKRIGKEIEIFVQSSELKETLLNLKKELENHIKEYDFENIFDAKSIAENLKKDLYRTGILYQNWSELTDAAKKINPIILEELLLSV